LHVLLCENGCEDLWLFVKAKRGTWAKYLGKCHKPLWNAKC
jgi:hypothetical protein